MSEERQSALRAAADEYRRTRADAKQARDDLVEQIRAEYAGGMKQAAILREIDHVWTREYVRVVLGLTGPADPTS